MDRHSSITVDEAKSTIAEFLKTLTEKYDCLFDDGTDSEGKAEFTVVAKGSNVRVWFDEDKQLYGFDQTDGKGSKNNADFDLLKPVLDSYIHIQVSLLPVANMIADEYKDSIGKEISKGKVGGKSATGYRVMYRVAGVTDSVLIVRNLKDNIYVLEVTECFKKEDGKMGMGDVLETYTYEVVGNSVKEISDADDTDEVSVEDSEVSAEVDEVSIEDSELAVEEPVKHKTILESLVEKESDEDITYKDGKAIVDSDIADLVIIDKGDWVVVESGTQYKGLYKLAKSITMPINESDSLFKLIMGVLDTPNNWVVSNEVFSSILDNTGATLDEDRLVLDGKILGKAVIDNDTLIIGEEVIPSLEYFKDFYNLGVSETEASEEPVEESAGNNEEFDEPVEESAGIVEESAGDAEELDEPTEESEELVEADETDVTVESEDETFDMEEPTETIETEAEGGVEADDATESEEPTEVFEESSEEVVGIFEEVDDSDESNESSEEVADISEEIAESDEEDTDASEEVAESDSNEESTDTESSEVVTADATESDLGVVETEVDNSAGGSSMIEVKVNEVPVSTGTQVKNFSDETGKEFVRIIKDGQIYDISAEVAERLGVRQNRIGSRTELINKYGVLLDPDEFGLKTVTTVVSDDDEDKIAELIYSLFE